VTGLVIVNYSFLSYTCLIFQRYNTQLVRVNGVELK